ncbi:MAG: hypothetical protein SFZ23_01730 [Planctomycetota bacterium]|nr:hypothetical protein [Planctomycetota bacterium]
MSNTPSNNGSSGASGGGLGSGPGGTEFPRLSDEVLLSYVEHTLSESERARVERALAAVPAIRARVEGMIRDRAIIAELAHASAPSDLLARVEMVLERESLLDSAPFALGRASGVRHSGIASGTGSAIGQELARVERESKAIGPIPIGSHVQRVWMSPRVWGAVAASIAFLGVSAAIWFGESITSLMAGDSRRAAKVLSPGDELAANDSGANESEASLLAAGPEAMLMNETPEIDDATHDVGAYLPPLRLAALATSGDTEISLERAAELAREGRLGVRVLVASTFRAERKLQTAANIVTASRSWKLSSDVPQPVLAWARTRADEALRSAPAIEYAMAMDRTQQLVSKVSEIPLPTSLVTPGLTAREPLAAAQESELRESPARGERSTDSARQQSLGSVAADARAMTSATAFVASTTATPEGIGSLRAALASIANGSVVFEELESPVLGAGSDSAERLLWWPRASVHWSSKADVPVSVERVPRP